jgi:biopolymer transport protein ExbD/biopolymer transport protein TolR
VTPQPGIEPPVQPDINVTPLVDVVLVLLIIFMVVAPRLEHDVPVNLPGVVNPDPEGAGGTDPLKVTLAATGQIFIDGEPYDLDAAQAVLQEAHVADPLRRLELRGDESLAYGQVRALCARARKIGFPGVALLVGEQHRHEGGSGDDGPEGRREAQKG